MYRFQRWKPLIESAASEAELLTILREYKETFLPSDLAQLPTGCPAPGMASSMEEILALAVEFARWELKAEPDTRASELLHELARTFRAGAERSAKLRRTDPQPMP